MRRVSVWMTRGGGGGRGLRFDLDLVTPSIFSKPPDFEAPVDSDSDNVYEVTVQPTTASDSTAIPVVVTVTVTDAEEAGTLALSTKRPRTGVEVTAVLSDPDVVVDGSQVWVWERTAGNNNWVVIAGADSSAYTPVAADAGSFLRVSVTYTDNHSSTAQAHATAPEVVAAAQLNALSVSTHNSDASTGTDEWRLMRPAFSAETLHYSVGCNNTDTMTLTLSAADAATRISVDGIQYANPGAGTSFTATRAVTGDSIVRIALADEDGAQTQYVVHCLANNFARVEVTKLLGEEEMLDELILYAGSGRMVALNSNGGPRALAQGSVAPQIDSGPSFSVEEGTAMVATLVATDTDTDAGDLEWSITAGADQSHFTLTDAGELSFAAAKDFENPGDSDSDGVYEVSVSVSDGSDSDTAALTVTVTNVIELTTLAGPADVEHSENWAGRVATYSASSAADAAGLVWSLSGVDAARFSIDDPGGALRFSIEPTGDDLFLQLPDFDDPLDDDSDGTYEVTVHVEGGGDQQTLDVEVTVTDEPEPGTLALSSTQPRLGETLTTTLTDPDGVTGAVTYVWERSVGRGTWETLTGTAASRVPTAADSGHFLRVTATYEDGHGTANTATARTSEVVTADRLTALTVSTTDSTANPGHALRPSFDAGILHYSIGCAASDTMTLTATAGTGVRLSINGTQVTSGESHTAAVEADSEVRVTLAAASGAATTYFVRCLSGDLLDMTATTASGATGVIEDLIVFGVANKGERSIAIVDSNGAVRFHDKDANWSGGYVRAAWVSAAGEYRYAYHKVGQQWQILNQNLESIASVATVAPLTDTNRHDMTLLDDGNYILMAYEPVERDLSGLTFGNFGTSVRMRDSAIQIRTPGGTPLLTWSSHDAIPFEDCKPTFPPGYSDYAHLNTLQMVDGHIVASFRGCNSVLRIDPDDASSHKVVWRLALTNLTDEQWDGLGKGPPPLDIIGDAEGQICGQHGSSLLPNGHLILFDNWVSCMRDPWLNTQLLARPGPMYSRAVEYALDVDNGEAVFLRDHSLGGTRSRRGAIHGHVEALPNGDWLIGWGAHRQGRARPMCPSPRSTRTPVRRSSR